MSDYSQFADRSSDNGGYASADQFQSPLFLKRLNDWMHWAKVFGWTLIAAGALTIGLAVLRLLSALSDLGPRDGRGGLVLGMVLVLIVVFVALFLPGIFLMQAGRHTKSYLQTDDPEELVSSFRTLRSFWLTVGIVAGILIALFCVLIPFLLSAAARPMG
jgi:hypothetical protein